jgi:lipid II:glycine glycyltransferase (peptidoglycan interpeptide bridge formation enzyme)
MAWNVCTRSDWDGYLRRVGRSSLEQSWAYGEAMASHYGQTIDRIVFRRNNQTLGVLQVFRRRVLGFASIIRIIRGPLFLDDLTDALRFEIYQAVRDIFPFRRWEIPLWLPEAPDVSESHVLMRRLGTRRMVTGLSSAWLDLSADNDTLRSRMTGSWRNALKAAEKTGTTVDLEDNRRSLVELMGEYDSFRKIKRFVGPPGRFVAAMNTNPGSLKDVIVLSAHADGKRVAGVVLIRHGVSATYFVSWTNDAGRRHNAHNLLLWRGIQALKDAGTLWLDLGGLNTSATAGIARFKLGLGPKPFTLAGTYL